MSVLKKVFSAILFEFNIRLRKFDFLSKIIDKKVIDNWNKQGQPVPPPGVVKRNIIKQYGKIFGTDIFVETGTFLGNTVDSCRSSFNKIYSIELDKKLVVRAEKRFKKYKHITILEGDSEKILPEILNNITSPALFWLDAHYSGLNTAKAIIETPIMKELEFVFNHPIKDHVVLIDDARLFVDKDDYPLLDELKEHILTKRPGLIFEVKDDMIRIHQKIT